MTTAVRELSPDPRNLALDVLDLDLIGHVSTEPADMLIATSMSVGQVRATPG